MNQAIETILEVILVVLAIYAEIGHAKHHYEIVKCCSDKTDNQQYILLFKNSYRYINDKEAVESLGFDPNSLQQITSTDLQHKVHRTPAVPLIKNDRTNPDAIMALELARIRSIVPKTLTYDYTMVCDGCKNPAVLKWHNQLITVSEFTSIKGDVLHIFWVNASTIPLEYSDLFGITTSPNDAIGGVTIPGTDARILVHPKTNNLIVAYYPRFRYPLRVGYAELSITEDKKAVWVNMYDSIIPDKQEFPKEKNWAPFFHDNKLLFVQTINPLHVVSVTEANDKKYLQATTISSEYAEIDWAYGQLRSGSNPVRLHDRHLAFFHSIGDLGSGYKTYFFGAYTFSLAPPFKILSYSPMPIVDDLMYTGPWYNFRGIKYDYAAYPMALFVEKKGVLHLSFGHNDVRGFVCRMNVEDVLESMVPTPGNEPYPIKKREI